MPDSDENEPFLDWITKVENTPNPPVVFSVSYGEPESNEFERYNYLLMGEHFIIAASKSLGLKDLPTPKYLIDLRKVNTYRPIFNAVIMKCSLRMFIFLRLERYVPSRNSF